MIVLPNGQVVPDQSMAQAQAIDQTNLRQRQLANQILMERMRQQQAQAELVARERMAGDQRAATERMAGQVNARELERIAAQERVGTGRNTTDLERARVNLQVAEAQARAGNRNALMNIVGQVYLRGLISPEQRSVALAMLSDHTNAVELAREARGKIDPLTFNKLVEQAAIAEGFNNDADDEENAKRFAKAMVKVRKELSSAYKGILVPSGNADAPRTLAELKNNFFTESNMPLMAREPKMPPGVAAIASAADTNDINKVARALQNIVGMQGESTQPKVVKGGGGAIDEQAGQTTDENEATPAWNSQGEEVEEGEGELAAAPVKYPKQIVEGDISQWYRSPYDVVRQPASTRAPNIYPLAYQGGIGEGQPAAEPPQAVSNIRRQAEWGPVLPPSNYTSGIGPTRFPLYPGYTGPAAEPPQAVSNIRRQAEWGPVLPPSNYTSGIGPTRFPVDPGYTGPTNVTDFAGLIKAIYETDPSQPQTPIEKP